ncbi:MAG: nickel-binding protein [candidate division WOR-3 bacterium]
MDASVGSNVKMDRAYIDEKTGQATCCWSAPDQKTIESVFAKAGVKPESIKSVVIYSG